MSAYMDTQIKEAQTNNLKANETVMQQEALLKAAQTLQTFQNTEMSKFDLEQRQKLSDYVIEAARLNIQKTIAEIKGTEAQTGKVPFEIEKLKQDSNFTRMTNIRMQQLHPVTIRKLEAEISAIKQSNRLSEKQIGKMSFEVLNLIKDGKLKDLEIDLRKKGINPNDPAWQRAIQNFVQEVGKPLGAVQDGKYDVKYRSWPNTFSGWMERFSPY